MAEASAESEVANYPIVLRHLGDDLVALTSYQSVEKGYGGRETRVSRTIPRFYRMLPTNTTIEIEHGDETLYFTVAELPRGAKENSIYIRPIEKPSNLEELRMAGNVVMPDFMEIKP